MMKIFGFHPLYQSNAVSEPYMSQQRHAHKKIFQNVAATSLLWAINPISPKISMIEKASPA